MIKIAVIVPYFGKFPVWIDLYLYSVSRNPMLDVLFFTDCEIPKVTYPNTIFHKITFKEYCKHVSKILNINFVPQDTYKLCDLKVFYGIIHEKDLKNYSFWAFGDIDLIYGDMNVIINEKNLNKYNIITTHSYHIAGHFTVIRKKSKYTTLCKQLTDWETLLTDQKHYALDEGIWSNLVYPELKNIRRLYTYFIKKLNISFFCYLRIINPIFCNRFSKRSFAEYYTTPNPQEGQTWTYDLKKGDIVDEKHGSVPYLHFLFFKKTPWKPSNIFWKDSYYQLPHIQDLLKENDDYLVKIDNKKIYIT